jgi:glucose-1-phosphate thymidylyltransferase
LAQDLDYLGKRWPDVNPDQEGEDHGERRLWGRKNTSQGSCILGGDLYTGRGVIIEPFCLFDTRNGPIYLDEGTEVRSHTIIRGPTYIGPNSTLLGGTIGPDVVVMGGCKANGEIQSSIMMSHSNMSHHGLIAHSYISEWVNIGSNTTLCNLKNTYGPVRVRSNGETIDTRLTKLGSFIADHAKISSGSLTNPGISIGVASHVYGKVSRNVPSFMIWGDGNSTETKEITLESAIETRNRIMARRNIKGDLKGKIIFEHLYKRTKLDREEIIVT